jgi:hypothetical protein
MLQALCRLDDRRPVRLRQLPSLESLEDRSLPAIIGGMVYADLNNNGIHDPNEAGLANSTIQLMNASGNLVGTTTSDATGHYSFSTDSSVSTAATTKTVEANLDNTLTDSTGTLSVAQFDPSLGTLTGIDVIADATLTTQAKVENLGSASVPVAAEVDGTVTLQGPGGVTLTASPQAKLTGTAGASDNMADLKGGDTWDSGQQSVPAQEQKVSLSPNAQDVSGFVGTGNVSFTATGTAKSTAAGPGNLLAMIHTGTSAHIKVVYHYTPSNALKPGSYMVVQTQPPPGSYVNGLDTSDNVTPIPGSNTNRVIPVTLGSSDSLNNNFGELPPSSLSGVVYVDNTGSGAFTPGNPPLSGVQITLAGTDVFNSPVNKVTQTANDGTYSFASLLPGSYTITKTQPAGYVDAVNTLGTLGGQINGDSMSVQLGIGLDGLNYNFGEKTAPTIAPNVTPNPVPAPNVTPNPVPTPTTPPDSGLAPIKQILTGGWGNGWGWF